MSELKQLKKENEVLKRALEVQYNRNKTIEEIQKAIDSINKCVIYHTDELKEMIFSLYPKKAKIIKIEITNMEPICFQEVTRYRLVFELEDGTKKVINKETNNLMQKPLSENEFIEFCSKECNIEFL